MEIYIDFYIKFYYKLSLIIIGVSGVVGALVALVLNFKSWLRLRKMIKTTGKIIKHQIEISSDDYGGVSESRYPVVEYVDIVGTSHQIIIISGFGYDGYDKAYAVGCVINVAYPIDKPDKGIEWSYKQLIDKLMTGVFGSLCFTVLAVIIWVSSE
jgi:hypothetical protein